MVWQMSSCYALVSCLTLWFYKLSAWKKILYQSQAKQKSMEEKYVYAETEGKKLL